MKTKQAFFLGLLGLVSLLTNAQNIQTTQLTSGGLQAGTNTSGFGGHAYYGYKAGVLSNSTGAGNTYIGHQSGKNITGGTYNTFLGYNSGTDLISGNYNTFLGANTGSLSGSANTYM
jgi:hypothetical protein